MASFLHGASDWNLGSSLLLCGVDGSQVHCGLQEVQVQSVRASDLHFKEEDDFIFAVTVVFEVMIDFSVSSFKQYVTQLISVTWFVESSLFKKNYY